uniref:Uncharacterized protein n=1 Tax=Plectus sambesii TaxID=2011161 RepID=A0A914VQ17_9BILA
MNFRVFVALAAFLSVAFGDDCSQTGVCTSAETCCQLSSTQVGCCPLQNAVCCSDHQTCCPNGYQCDGSGGCTQGGGPQTTPGTGGSTSCPQSSSAVKDGDRQAMVDSHNAYRSKLTKGHQPDRKGYMNPTGRNMYKLVWDCQLEKEAQAWSDACVYAHSSSSQRHGAGENLFAQYGSPMDAHYNFVTAADDWWGEATTAWTARANNVFTSSDLNAGHFTQMAWGKTYKVGCGMSACKGIFGSNVAAYVVCRYVDAGNYINEPVYQPGTPCSNSAACSTGIASKCEASSGLCIIGGSKQIPNILNVIPQEKVRYIKSSSFH